MSTKPAPVEYVHRYSFDPWGAHVTIGIYDPDLWDGQGGIAFGLEASVHVHYFTGTKKPPGITVNQGSMGCDIETATLKADVYDQAIVVARCIEKCLAEGKPLEHLENFIPLVENGGHTPVRFGGPR